MKSNSEFFAAMRLRRHEPGNCVRCGNPNSDAQHKTCPTCRLRMSAAQARRKAAKAGQDAERLERNKLKDRVRRLEGWLSDLLAARKVLEQTQRRVDGHDLAIARLDVSVQRDHNRTFGKAYRAGARHERKHSEYAPETISIQEVATMKHAYARP
ncbi:MAG: hypothetical protein KGI71_05575 [Patescibacteria group bacterium]|nr:hypothetical protein [Patescibacteria group bacterium]